MIKLSQNVLQKLKCSFCHGYLNNSPLMVSTAGAQLCGRCFKILPKDEQNGYVREVGLEAIAEETTFPCRNHTKGCKYLTFFNSDEDHERDCPNQIESSTEVDNKVYYTSEQFKYANITLIQQCNNVKMTLGFLVKENKSSKKKLLLKYTMDIQGSKDALCTISDNKVRSVSLNLEGAVSLVNDPCSVYCDFKTKELPSVPQSDSEHTYDTISSFRRRICVNCGKTITKEVYHCSLLHEACVNCRGKVCKSCSTSVGSTAEYHCKNYQLGCNSSFRFNDLSRHETDCEYNSFSCPISNCSYHATLKDTKTHVKNMHQDQIILNKETKRNATSSDQYWIMFAYDCIFKCKYYYYKDQVDLIVIYLGAHDSSRRFRYEIETQINGRTLKRTRPCLGWNGVSLDSGISVTRLELRELMGQNKNYKFDFDYTLRIFEDAKYI